MTTTTDQRDALNRALKEALVMLSTIHKDEYENCKRNCVLDGTIVSKQDLQDFEDSWQQYSCHDKLMYKIPSFIEKWK